MMNTENMNGHRAGQYVRQLPGYRAFIPKPLPPHPPIQMDGEIQKLLSRADRALGRLDGTTEILPNPDLFVAMYVRKEAVLSSQIEGTRASLIDILEFESDAMVPDNPQDIAEVVNYIDALNYGLQRLETLPVSLRLIREIHERLMANVRGADKHPGEFRSTQNWIGHVGSTIETAKYVPPPVPDMKQALSDLEHFLHEDDTLPLLIKVGLVHAQFETVHPFLDGNGRMGRLLITFLLCKEGVLQRPLLYLSHFFKQNKQEYYEHLQRVRDEGDWESWLKFFLSGVGTVAQQATYTARNIVRLRERDRNLIMEELGSSAGSALRLLEHLYKRPVMNISRAAEILDRKYPNASRIVMKLYELGILVELTEKQRNRMFMYDEYFNMLEQEPLLGETNASEGQEGI
ncbi:MAG TPA: Fic family protein [Ktedonobacterales bacterium]|nr:Fic family protein [Ktedonobacterales bacterium]